MNLLPQAENIQHRAEQWEQQSQEPETRGGDTRTHDLHLPSDPHLASVTRPVTPPCGPSEEPQPHAGLLTPNGLHLANKRETGEGTSTRGGLDNLLVFWSLNEKDLEFL